MEFVIAFSVLLMFFLGALVLLNSFASDTSAVEKAGAKNTLDILQSRLEFSLLTDGEVVFSMSLPQDIAGLASTLQKDDICGRNMVGHTGSNISVIRVEADGKAIMSRDLPFFYNKTPLKPGKTIYNITKNAKGIYIS